MVLICIVSSDHQLELYDEGCSSKVFGSELHLEKLSWLMITYP